MALTHGDMNKKIAEAASYLKDKAADMERSQSGGIGDGRSHAHAKLEELKRLFSSFESDLKNRG